MFGLILILFMLWIIVYICISEKQEEKYRKKEYERFRSIIKRMHIFENNQNELLDCINTLSIQLERLENEKKNKC